MPSSDLGVPAVLLSGRPDLEPRCPSCRRRLDRFARCRRRTCPAYFVIWAGDVARYLRENMALTSAAWDLITITPPGASDLPWDTARCRHAPGLPCSGDRGCVVHPDALADWHASFRPRFNQLLKNAKAALYRRGHGVPRLVVVLEPQARGALHVHLAAPTADRAATYELFCQLERRVRRHAFGGRVGWDPARGQDRAEKRGLGAYIAKLSRYVAKEAAGEAGGLREVLAAVPRHRVFSCSVRITRRTRCTMRNLRLVRFVWRRVRVNVPCRVAEERWRLISEAIAIGQLDAQVAEQVRALAQDAPPGATVHLGLDAALAVR